jgi:hypothetical protein
MLPRTHTYTTAGRLICVTCRVCQDRQQCVCKDSRGTPCALALPTALCQPRSIDRHTSWMREVRADTVRAIAGESMVGREGRGTELPTSSASMLGETRSSSVSPNPQCTTDMSKKLTRLRTGATFQLSTTAPIMPRYICARRRSQVRCDHDEGIGPRDAMARKSGHPLPILQPRHVLAWRFQTDAQLRACVPAQRQGASSGERSGGI